CHLLMARRTARISRGQPPCGIGPRSVQPPLSRRDARHCVKPPCLVPSETIDDGYSRPVTIGIGSPPCQGLRGIAALSEFAPAWLAASSREGKGRYAAGSGLI